MLGDSQNLIHFGAFGSISKFWFSKIFHILDVQIRSILDGQIFKSSISNFGQFFFGYFRPVFQNHHQILDNYCPFFKFWMPNLVIFDFWYFFNVQFPILIFLDLTTFGVNYLGLCFPIFGYFDQIWSFWSNLGNSNFGCSMKFQFKICNFW